MEIGNQDVFESNLGGNPKERNVERTKRIKTVTVERIASGIVAYAVTDRANNRSTRKNIQNEKYKYCCANRRRAIHCAERIILLPNAPKLRDRDWREETQSRNRAGRQPLFAGAHR